VKVILRVIKRDKISTKKERYLNDLSKRESKKSTREREKGVKF
jgi:hypothetical protein